MIQVVSTQTMRESDRWTIENLTSSKTLMYRAGEGIFNNVKWHNPIAIVCGKGNNAGDGFVLANLLKTNGYHVDIFLCADEFSEDGKYYYDIATNNNVVVYRFEENSSLANYNTVVDCIFGTGFRGTPAGVYKRAIEAINESDAYIVSCDINSGLNGDTGEGETYVQSDMTVSIGCFKPGHFIGKACNAIKDKINIDIGIKIIGPYINIEEIK